MSLLPYKIFFLIKIKNIVESYTTLVNTIYKKAMVCEGLQYDGKQKSVPLPVKGLEIS